MSTNRNRNRNRNTTPPTAGPAGLVEKKREELRLAELHGRLDLSKRLRDELNQLKN